MPIIHFLYFFGGGNPKKWNPIIHFLIAKYIFIAPKYNIHIWFKPGIMNGVIIKLSTREMLTSIYGVHFKDFKERNHFI